MARTLIFTLSWVELVLAKQDPIHQCNTNNNVTGPADPAGRRETSCAIETSCALLWKKKSYGCPINPRHLDLQLRFSFSSSMRRHLSGRPHGAVCRSPVPNFFPLCSLLRHSRWRNGAHGIDDSSMNVFLSLACWLFLILLFWLVWALFTSILNFKFLHSLYYINL
jgi:hypothetical protein